MKKKYIYFPIIFHFHQPVDNLDWVYEDCYNKSYFPLMKEIYNHPKIKFTLHFTGSLLKWLLEKKPEFKKMLLESISRGQIEIIGGGYYEPIFAVIHERDRIAQIKMLTDAVKRELGCEVQGAWLSERVWEPNYPSFLVKTGLKYIIVDDNHLRSCGLSEEDTFHTYTTEDSGNIITIFPINEKIRYLAPWYPAKDSIEYLEKNANEEGDRIIVFLSDAEKMGVWATTHELCYIKGHPADNYVPYIPAFFTAVENSEFIKTITLSECIKQFKSKGLIYLPTASYDKMEQWVLPTPVRMKIETLMNQIAEDEKLQYNRKFPDYLKIFIRGGFWRYFLVKYPESNNMHKKMYYVRDKLEKLEEYINSLSEKNLNDLKITKDKINSFKRLINEAWDEIYKSQCNDCYWHGLFGGVYLYFLRFAVYKHLIRAENIIDSIEKELNIAKNYHYEFIDFDMDSNNEFIFKTSLFWFGIKLSDGGTIFELDCKNNCYNLLNTLTRWLEAYHDINKIPYDRWRKSALRDHIIYNSTSLTEFQNEKYNELGSFVSQEYSAEIIENQDENNVIVKLKANGFIKIEKEQGKLIRVPLCLIKLIQLNLSNHELVVSYYMNRNIPKNLSDEHTLIKIEDFQIPQDELNKLLQNLCLTIDIPLMLSGDENKFQSFIDNNQNDFFSSIETKFKQIKFLDPMYNQSFMIEIENNDENKNTFLSAFKYPIFCYAQTENGYKNIYQGINVALRLNLLELINSNYGFEFKLKF